MEKEMYKKLAIVTFQRAYNYGALLQAYALQTIIEELGHECDIIDYSPQMYDRYFNLTNLKSCKNIKQFCWFLIHGRKKKEVFKRFQEFSDQYFNLKHFTADINDLRLIEDDYDGFIAGSDQVWNYNISNFDEVFFLSFVENEKKKNSYAASIGLDKIPDEYKAKYRKLLKDFNNILVREKQAKDILEELIDHPIEVVLDPTMLIEEKKWDLIINDPMVKIDNYILVYVKLRTESIIAFVEELSRIKKCSIIDITDLNRKWKKAKFPPKTGPGEFLYYLKNARYVVTNSFHGTALSIVFNKQLFIEYVPESKKLSSTNSRLSNLVDMFNLKARLISSNIGKPDIDSWIDYESVNQILDKERKHSIKYLKMMIESLE